MSWTLINRIHALETNTHYLFTHSDGRRAIADHSIKSLGDPGSTEDGLLRLDCSRPLDVTVSDRYGVIARVPVLNRFQEQSSVWTDPTLAVQWAAEGGVSIQISPKLEKILRTLLPYLPASAAPLANAA